MNVSWDWVTATPWHLLCAIVVVYVVLRLVRIFVV